MNKLVIVFKLIDIISSNICRFIVFIWIPLLQTKIDKKNWNNNLLNGDKYLISSINPSKKNKGAT